MRAFHPFDFVPKLHLGTRGEKQLLRAVRYTSLALLSVTLLKLFFHDLSELAQLYRIGALVAVAIIAMAMSFLYQRFFGAKRDIKSAE